MYIQDESGNKTEVCLSSAGNIVSDINAPGAKDVPNAKTVKDYVDKKQTYSTDEVVVGIYLGKPLYRKVISAKYSDGDTIISNIDTLVSCNGTASLGGVTRLIPYYEWYNNNSYRATIEQRGDALKAAVTYIGQASEATFKITLKYTKTTDEVVE